MAVPVRLDLAERLTGCDMRLTSGLRRLVQRSGERLTHLTRLMPAATDIVANRQQRADELGLSVSALVEQLFEAMQVPTEAPSSEFQALMDALEKVPPRSEDQFDPQDPYYKSAAASRHE